ncbi:MAG: hypothetical protein ABDH23_02340 [Endomicrobiia bacterium]
MNKILKELEEITNRSEGVKVDLNTLEVCRNCSLVGSEYSLCFYRKKLHLKSKNQVKYMFVSRDPNIECEEIIQKHNSATKVVLSWNPPKRQCLGNFFCDFLVDNNLWKEFMTYLANTRQNPVSRFLLDASC